MTVTKNEKLQIIPESGEIKQKSQKKEIKTVRLVVEDNRATTITTTVFEAPESPTGVSSVKTKTVMNVHNTFFGGK